MDEREIKVGLSTLVKLNKQINANTAEIEKLKSKKTAPAKKATKKKEQPKKK